MEAGQRPSLDFQQLLARSTLLGAGAADPAAAERVVPGLTSHVQSIRNFQYKVRDCRKQAALAVP